MNRRVKIVLFVIILFIITYFASKAVFNLTKVRYNYPNLPIPHYVYMSDENISTYYKEEMDYLKRVYPNQHTQWNSSDLISSNKLDPKTPSKSISIVTMIVKNKNSSWNIPDFSKYQSISSCAIDNFLLYSHRHNYPFFFMNKHLLNTNRKLYWGKIDIIRHYFSLGYDWIVWTDLDVLFMNHDIRLQTFIDNVPASAHFIGVLQTKFRKIASGFFIIRNSKQSLELLDFWDSLHDEYKNYDTPEQLALEFISTHSKWKELFFFHPSRLFHCFTEFYELNVSLSVHFTNLERKWYLPDWYKQVKMIDSDFHVK